jgi:GrpB-like predicted nucleotidyltransferase (UPF0157 family)
VPFADELGDVRVVVHRGSWSDEFEAIASALDALAPGDGWIIDHVGSTAVPGLAAKDVIDVQIRVAAIQRDPMIERFEPLGLRWRPEGWNNVETTRADPEPKLVFAPPVGARPANIHVREASSQGARDTLLFRDFLRADPTERDRWCEFKRELAGPGVDLLTCGQATAPAWADLMVRADAWADSIGWRPVTPPTST